MLVRQWPTLERFLDPTLRVHVIGVSLRNRSVLVCHFVPILVAPTVTLIQLQFLEEAFQFVGIQICQVALPKIDIFLLRIAPSALPPVPLPRLHRAAAASASASTILAGVAHLLPQLGLAEPFPLVAGDCHELLVHIAIVSCVLNALRLRVVGRELVEFARGRRVGVLALPYRRVDEVLHRVRNALRVLVLLLPGSLADRGLDSGAVEKTAHASGQVVLGWRPVADLVVQDWTHYAGVVQAVWLASSDLLRLYEQLRLGSRDHVRVTVL